MRLFLCLFLAGCSCGDGADTDRPDADARPPDARPDARSDADAAIDAKDDADATSDADAPPMTDATPGMVARDFALGENHTCAIEDEAGHVECWGYNQDGVLGVGSTADIARGRVIGIEGARSIAAGDYHTCVVLDDRTVSCWGYNTAGQVGTGDVSDAEPMPSIVDGLSDVVALAINHHTSCAQIEGGAVSCWGENDQSQIESGTANVLAPRPVADFAGATAVAVGNYHICAIVDGAVRCRGSLDAVSFTGEVTAISSGWQHSCAIAEGVVWCWGSGYLGVLGYPTSADPAPLMSVPGVPTTMVALSTKIYASCALGADGSLWCWGNNQGGAIDTDAPHEPGYTATMRATGVDRAAVGGVHVCVADPTMRCWGNDGSGAVTGTMP